jgi:hypothetical protein
MRLTMPHAKDTCAISSNASALIPRADWPNYSRTNGRRGARLPLPPDRFSHGLLGTATPGKDRTSATPGGRWSHFVSFATRSIIGGDANKEGQSHP